MSEESRGIPVNIAAAYEKNRQAWIDSMTGVCVAVEAYFANPKFRKFQMQTLKRNFMRYQEARKIYFDMP